MHLTLTIEADHPGELTPFLASFGRQPDAVGIKEIEPADAPLEEEEPEAPPAPKKSRGRKADAAKQGTPDTKSPPASSDGPTATTDASPSEEKVTFEDLRAAASSLMDSGKVDGRAIQDMLIGKFDVRAFGALKEEQYADALAELNNL
jgi:hypothetical protein